MYNCYLKLLLLIIFAIPGLESTTTEGYCKLSQFHTMCLYPNDTPSKECGKVISSEITPEDRTYILDLHNGIRRKIAKGQLIPELEFHTQEVANMMKIRWDNELERIARRWALQCPQTTDDVRNIRGLRVYQNVHVDRHEMSTWRIAINFFIRDYVKIAQNSYKFNFKNKFIVMTWASNYVIGCGKVTYKKYDYDTISTVFVCNYGRNGTTKAEKYPKVGKACSACPKGMSCDDGLCVKTSKNAISSEFYGNLSPNFHKLFFT